MEHSYIIGGNVKWYKHFGKQMAVSYKHTLIIRPSNKKENRSPHKDLFTSVHSSLIHNSPDWKRPEWPRVTRHWNTQGSRKEYTNKRMEEGEGGGKRRWRRRERNKRKGEITPTLCETAELQRILKAARQKRRDYLLITISLTADKTATTNGPEDSGLTRKQ